MPVYPVNYNCPGQTVVSGERPADRSADRPRGGAQGHGRMKLPVSGAFHTPLYAFRRRKSSRRDLASMTFAAPRIPALRQPRPRSPTATPCSCSPQQVESPVRWEADRANAMMADGADTFVECGAGKTLSGLIARIDAQCQGLPRGGLTRPLRTRLPSIGGGSMTNGKVALVTGALPRHRPRHRAGAGAPGLGYRRRLCRKQPPPRRKPRQLIASETGRRALNSLRLRCGRRRRRDCPVQAGQCRTRPRVGVWSTTRASPGTACAAQLKEEDFDRGASTSILKGAFHLYPRTLSGFMRQRSRTDRQHFLRGRADRAMPGQANYAASKAGLIGLTKSVARELASRGRHLSTRSPPALSTPT